MRRGTPLLPRILHDVSKQFECVTPSYSSSPRRQAHMKKYQTRPGAFCGDKDRPSAPVKIYLSVTNTPAFMFERPSLAAIFTITNGGRRSLKCR